MCGGPETRFELTIVNFWTHSNPVVVRATKQIQVVLWWHRTRSRIIIVIGFRIVIEFRDEAVDVLLMECRDRHTGST